MTQILLPIALLCLFAASTLSNPLLVELPNGELRGRDNGLYYSYESIPYAEPPIDDLCLEEPRPYTERWENTFDATRPPVECLQWSQLISQPNKLTGSEDCLTVSIYKPKNLTRSSFPVVAHIFGGGWSFGGAIDDGVEPFMNSGNVIVVKINHRVGALGFLSTGDSVIPGNFGLKDQRLAIKWIRNNIARFGGDPHNIILLGFGTGGSSVHLQLMHKDMEQLVKGAISISGTATVPWAVQANARDLAFRYGKLLGCNNPKTSRELKDCLKKTDAEEFVSTLRHLQVFDYVPFGPFGPVVESPEVDSPFLTELPLDTIRSGNFAQVPWLASYTPENGIYNAALLLAKDANGKERIEELNTRWNELAPYFLAYPYTLKRTEMNAHSQKLKHQYLGYKNFSVENYFDVQRLFTNELFKKGIELSLDAHRKHGTSPVYAYVYDNPADNSLAQFLSKRSDIFLGTGMGDDYYLLMNNPLREPLRADEKIVSWKLVKMVEDFAAHETLVYDDCVFPSNLGKKKFQLVVIGRNYCKQLEVDRLPDTVSNNLPPNPIVIY
ncbi:esterase S [Drosophila novamexicana]|uniref:esterase S n=1 Tax=Drosophila novamexicana TaxID=47314 RepID=UPI0011E5A6ED|nr:esterase S [Drosophila novamexicana]